MQTSPKRTLIQAESTDTTATAAENKIAYKKLFLESEEDNENEENREVKRKLRNQFWAKFTLEEKIAEISSLSREDKYNCPGYDYKLRYISNDEFIEMFDRVLNKELFLKYVYGRSSGNMKFSLDLMDLECFVSREHVRIHGIFNNAEPEFNPDEEDLALKEQLVAVLDRYEINSAEFQAKVAKKYKHDYEGIYTTDDEEDTYDEMYDQHP